MGTAFSLRAFQLRVFFFVLLFVGVFVVALLLRACVRMLTARLFAIYLWRVDAHNARRTTRNFARYAETAVC